MATENIFGNVDMNSLAEDLIWHYIDIAQQVGQFVFN